LARTVAGPRTVSKRESLLWRCFAPGHVPPSAFLSGYHIVRLAIGIPQFSDLLDMAVLPSFDGQSADILPVGPEGGGNRRSATYCSKNHAKCDEITLDEIERITI
jgi:hypothetical protein